ncbi:MAG: hypothetical protein QM736_11840 [Vicinamibacterales bacterium]
MAMRFRVDPGDDRCTITFAGILTAVDVKAAVQALIGAGAWTRNVLVDTRDVSQVVATAHDLHALADFLDRTTRHLPPRSRTVILADDDVLVGYARMYQSRVDGLLHMTVNVVRTEAEANAWLA